MPVPCSDWVGGWGGGGGNPHRGIPSGKGLRRECCWGESGCGERVESGLGSRLPIRGHGRPRQGRPASPLPGRASGTPESGSESLSTKLSPGTKPLSRHVGWGGWGWQEDGGRQGRQPRPVDSPPPSARFPLPPPSSSRGKLPRQSRPARPHPPRAPAGASQSRGVGAAPPRGEGASSARYLQGEVGTPAPEETRCIARPPPPPQPREAVPLRRYPELAGALRRRRPCSPRSAALAAPGLRCPATATVKLSPAPCAPGEPRPSGRAAARIGCRAAGSAPLPKAAPLPASVARAAAGSLPGAPLRVRSRAGRGFLRAPRARDSAPGPCSFSLARPGRDTHKGQRKRKRFL